MFEKQRIAFSNKDIFGLRFKADVRACFCTVSQMLFDDKINLDGTIDISKVVSLTKYELWCYVYYLFFHNQTNVPIFRSMVNPETGKASAPLFYEAVLSMVQDEKYTAREDLPARALDPTTLVLFINEVLEEFGKQLVNPIFDYLHVIMQKNIMSRIANVTIKTGDKNTDRIKIVTDQRNVDDANVKVDLTVDGEDKIK